ncbi:MAG: hypothetical protein R3C39_14765 [Dehalococcoidia bacterium]
MNEHVMVWRRSPARAIGLGLGLAVAVLMVWPGGGRLEAAAPAPTVDSFVLEASAPYGGGCNLTFVATWDSDELRGPNVSSRIYDMDNGTAMVAGEFRAEDDGFARLTVPSAERGAHTYEFALVRGGQDRVLASAAIDLEVSC